MSSPSPMLSPERKQILVKKKTTLSQSARGPNLTILLSELQGMKVLTMQQVDAAEAEKTPFEKMAAVVTGIIASGTEQSYEHFLETLELPNVGLGHLATLLRNEEVRTFQMDT